MSFWRLLCAEWQAVRADSAVMLVLFGGILFYAVLYPLPYKHNVAGEQPVVVIDQDRTALSRTLIRRVNATPQVRVSDQVFSVAEARERLVAGAAHGMLVIPEHFQRDVLRGSPTTLSYAGDASYFLIYGTVAEGLLTAGTTLVLETQALRSLMVRDSQAPLAAQLQPVRVLAKPVFNAVGGYLNYVLPAVFVLILHQTMLITLGGITVKDRARRTAGVVSTPLLPALLARLLLFVGLYMLFASLYFGFFLALNGVQAVAPLAQLLLFTLMFLVTTALLSLMLGYCWTAPEQPILLVLISSLPLVFTIGFAWPVTSLPGWLDALVNLVPARPGIQGLLALNQMGAPWSVLAPQAGWLLGQGLLFVALLMWRVRTTRT